MKEWSVRRIKNKPPEIRDIFDPVTLKNKNHVRTNWKI